MHKSKKVANVIITVMPSLIMSVFCTSESKTDLYANHRQPTSSTTGRTPMPLDRQLRAVPTQGKVDTHKPPYQSSSQWSVSTPSLLSLSSLVGCRLLHKMDKKMILSKRFLNRPPKKSKHSQSAKRMVLVRKNR